MEHNKFVRNLESSIQSLFQTWNAPFRVSNKLGMLHSEYSKIFQKHCKIFSLRRHHEKKQLKIVTKKEGNCDQVRVT